MYCLIACVIAGKIYHRFFVERSIVFETTREKLYSEDVDAVLRKREYLVRSLFEAYATFKISNTKEVKGGQHRREFPVKGMTPLPGCL